MDACNALDELYREHKPNDPRCNLHKYFIDYIHFDNP